MKPLKESFIKAKDLDNLNKKKYVLTNETLNLNGHTLYRIQALKDILSIKVKKGDLGGWVESYNNLDHEGDCWVRDEAKVYRNAKVYEDAQVYGKAWVHGQSIVGGNAKVYDNAEVRSNAMIIGNAEICGTAKVDHDVNKGKINK